MHKTQTTPPTPNKGQQTKPVITTERILNVLSTEWQPITTLIFKLKIKNMLDARYLQLKLKELERKQQVLVEVERGKKHWKLIKFPAKDGKLREQQKL